MSAKATPAAEILERVVKRDRARASKPKRALASYERAVENARDRFLDEKNPDFSNLNAESLIGIYCYLHEKVYGVLPEELADEWYPALAVAKKFLERNAGRFDVPEFMRWVWKRERRSREKDPEREFRIGWRLQFSQRLVTDYRVQTKK